MPDVVVGRLEPDTKKVAAVVLREAIAGGSISDAVELYGAKLSIAQRDVIKSISDAELARFRQVAREIDIPGDKLA